MALHYTMHDGDTPVRAKGMVDGTVPFHFEDHGDHWIASVGTEWQHVERLTGTRAGQPKAEARRNIYRAIALFRGQTKRFSQPGYRVCAD